MQAVPFHNFPSPKPIKLPTTRHFPPKDRDEAFNCLLNAVRYVSDCFGPEMNQEQMLANVDARTILQRAQDAVLRQFEVSKEQLVSDLFGVIRYERVK